MRLSCLPVSLFGKIIEGSMGIDHWAALGTSLGLDGIDISVLFLKTLDKSYLREIRRGVERESIRMAVMNTYPDLTHPKESERSREISRLEAHIEAAALLGAEMVRVTAGQGHPETGRAEGAEWAVQGLRRAAGRAEYAGVRVVYENHSKPGVWDYPDFSYPSEIFLEIADRLQDTMKPVLEVCRDHDVPLMIHANETVGHAYPGKTPLELGDLYRFVKHAAPQPIVLAHWGGGLFFYELMKREVRDALRHVCYDTAASPYLYRPRVYTLAVELCGPERILFGSDYPLMPPSRLIKELDTLALPPATREKVLSENARRLLNILTFR